MVFYCCFASVVLVFLTLAAVLKRLQLSPTCCRTRLLLFSLVSLSSLMYLPIFVYLICFFFFPGMHEV
jgi:hypothetical protein